MVVREQCAIALDEVPDRRDHLDIGGHVRVVPVEVDVVEEDLNNVVNPTLALAAARRDRSARRRRVPRGRCAGGALIAPGDQNRHRCEHSDRDSNSHKAWLEHHVSPPVQLA